MTGDAHIGLLLRQGGSKIAGPAPHQGQVRVKVLQESVLHVGAPGHVDSQQLTVVQFLRKVKFQNG